MTIHKFDNDITLETSYVFPSIPIRGFDWSCVNPDTYDGAEDGNNTIGVGATEQEAIDDWFENYENERSN